MSERDIEAGRLAVGWEKGRIRKLPLSRVIYVKRARKLLTRYPLDGDRNIVGKARLVFKGMLLPGDISRGWTLRRAQGLKRGRTR